MIAIMITNFQFSPRAWGWTEVKLRRVEANPVFPTRVGVDRRKLREWPTLRRFPHARGGGPCVPCARAGGAGVFPTRVGVDRISLHCMEG